MLNAAWCHEAGSKDWLACVNTAVGFFPEHSLWLKRCRLMENSSGWIGGRQAQVRQEELSILSIT